jgi:hypothetical protein
MDVLMLLLAGRWFAVVAGLNQLAAVAAAAIARTAGLGCTTSGFESPRKKVDDIREEIWKLCNSW